MILIEPDACVPRSALPKRELSRFLVDACERVGVQGEVTLLLTTDERMCELNRSFRRKNKPTDVLSFPPAPATFAGQTANGGDLAISVDTAIRQAKNLEHTVLVEVKILILHGLLHLAGLDHEQDIGQMGRRESKLRRHYELPVGLIQRAEKSAAAKPKAKTLVRTELAGPVSQERRDVEQPVSLKIAPKKPGKARAAKMPGSVATAKPPAAGASAQ